MITVSVINESEREVSLSSIKKTLETFLKKHNVSENSEVSVCIVNSEQMLTYVEKHLHETGKEAAAHPVLSFVQSETEGEFKFPPDNILHLGEIIVSIDHAKDINELNELISHGALHLLGIHHK